MKNILKLILIAGICANLSVMAQDTLQAGFINPPATAKARTWWHWINGNVSKEGITADLEAMKRVGIQEALLFNVDMGYPDGPVTFMSDNWLEMFRFAASEAKRLGLELGFHNGAGWSSSGGPWITPEYAMQTIVYTQVEVAGNGNKTQAIQLQQPPTRLDYYKDIAVFAFPKPENNLRIDNLEAKTLSGKIRNHLHPDIKPVPESALVKKKDIIDLTSAMSPDGSVKWEVPAGNWVILRIGHTPTGEENHPAAIGGRGLECDKMNKKAVDKHWQGAVKPVIDYLGPLIGSTITNCLIDSYEVGSTNWTGDFSEGFKRLRGYDCRLFLPALAGYYVESGEITERFLWDFRRTIGDLITENYYAHFRDLCHQHQMKFSMEPYWGPFNSMQVGETADIVTCEFWSGENAFFDSPKFVSSIAHLNGNTIVGAEAFTCYGGWHGHPATIKRIGDQAWTQGVSRLIIHTFAHQPWNIGPGMTLGRYGFEMNRLNTWWEQGKAYMDYIGRSQFLLQQGRNVADVLVFTGESSPNDALLMPEIKTLGFDYDLIGINKIPSLRAKDGIIYTSAGGQYRALVLKETEWMTPELLEKLEELTKNGALILGRKPLKSPSLKQYPQCDEKVAQISERLWNNNRIIDKEITDVLKEHNFVPDFYLESGSNEDIHYIHRRAGETEIYFVAGSQKESRLQTCRFRTAGKQPELWNPETGEISNAPVWKENTDGTISIPIRLETDGAIFVIFRKPISTSGHIVQTATKVQKPELEPLRDLKIIKAEYGKFLPESLIDVTEAVAGHVHDGILSVRAGTYLASHDPAQGSIKELRIEYQTGDKSNQVSVPEGETINIDAGDSGELYIRKAVYGKFNREIKGVPEIYPVIDITEQIKERLASGKLTIPVNEKLINTSEQDQKNYLRIVYTSAGEEIKKLIPDGYDLNLAQPMPEPELITEFNKVKWITPYPGELTYVTSSGKTKTVKVKSVPEPVELSGPWEVEFPKKHDKPEKTTFENLNSWSGHHDKAIRHFSGTATYKKQFTLPENMARDEQTLELDLGNVKVIAEVIVNGKNLGIIWKEPFRINLADAMHEGLNELTIKITNLWPNRLIGDEELPENMQWTNGQIKKWPEWLLNGTEQPSGRTTFATWKHWNKDDALYPSGLLGPVKIRTYERVEIEP